MRPLTSCSFVLVCLLAPALAGSNGFPLKEASGVSDIAGYGGFFSEEDAQRLFASNRARLLALRSDSATEAAVCDARKPFPRHQEAKLAYIHIPKAGSSFVTTFLRYACQSGSLPAYGDARPDCAEEPGQSKYGSACNYQAKDLFKLFGERCKEKHSVYFPPRGNYQFDVGWVLRQSYHAPMKQSIIASGGAYVGTFRPPDQRLTSAFHFDKHAWGMPPTYVASKPNAIEEFVRYPGVRGCQTKMLTNMGCGDLPRRGQRYLEIRNFTIDPALCYIAPANWSSRCHDALARQRPVHMAKLCSSGLDCVGPDARQAWRAVKTVRAMAFAGITELWGLSLCVFHRLLGGEIRPGDGNFANQQIREKGTSPFKYDHKPLRGFIDLADELVFKTVLDKFENEVNCIKAKLRLNQDTVPCLLWPAPPSKNGPPLALTAAAEATKAPSPCVDRPWTDRLGNTCATADPHFLSPDAVFAGDACCRFHVSEQATTGKQRGTSSDTGDAGDPNEEKFLRKFRTSFFKQDLIKAREERQRQRLSNY